MPVPQPRMATWQIVLVLAVAVLGLITTYEVSYATTPAPPPRPRPTPTPPPTPNEIWVTKACPGAISRDISWLEGVANRRLREASQHVGTPITVLGRVDRTNYASGSPGQPTFLELRGAYGSHMLLVVIWGMNRPNFPNAPEETYRDRFICVSGLLEMSPDTTQESYQPYRNVNLSQIEVTAPSQMVMAPEGLTASSSGEIIHVVKSGDTLFAIAQQYGVTTRDIVERNGDIDPRKLFVGTNLRIPTRPLTPPSIIQRPPTPMLVFRVSSPTPTPISPTPTLISPTPPPTATPSPSPIVPVGSIIAVTVLGIGVYQFIGKRIRTRDDD